MAAIAAGNQPAIWALREVADVPVQWRVRGELRRLGVRYDAEDLHGMVIDAVLAVAHMAGGWRPGGAPLWSWAHHRGHRRRPPVGGHGRRLARRPRRQ
jgi:hypothetical protein